MYDGSSKVLPPDKTAAGEGGHFAEGRFVTVQHAYTVLLHPLRRRTYDLFGPAAVTLWSDLASEREVLLRGVAWTVLPGYVVMFVVLQVYGLFGRGGQVKYVSTLRTPSILYPVSFVSCFFVSLFFGREGCMYVWC